MGCGYDSKDRDGPLERDGKGEGARRREGVRYGLKRRDPKKKAE